MIKPISLSTAFTGSQLRVFATNPCLEIIIVLELLKILHHDFIFS
jgi:hypothetical protein